MSSVSSSSSTFTISESSSLADSTYIVGAFLRDDVRPVESGFGTILPFDLGVSLGVPLAALVSFVVALTSFFGLTGVDLAGLLLGLEAK
jgi:hypothetical protein